MNFNFGTPKTTGSFTLGTPTSTPGAPGNLNFAAGDNKGLSATQLGGFGAPSNVTPTNTGFQLGTPASSATPTLAFGAPVASAPNLGFGGTASPAPTLPFGTVTSATASTLSFGTPISSAPPSLSFGATPLPLPFGGASAIQNLSFNTPKTTPAASTAANTSALTGFSLGSTLTAASTAPSFLSGSLAAATTVPTLSLGTPASSAPAPTFNLGSTLGAANTSTPTTGFTLGGVSSTGLTLGTPVTSTTFSLGTTPTSIQASTGLSLTITSAAPTLFSTATSTVAPVTQPGSFTFGQLEEALNKWTLELEDQGKMFINQALQLNAWDRLVISNGEKILNLNNGIEKVKQQQMQLDHELDFVLAQQRELEECIAPLEKELKDIPITDQDRNHTYQIAENMDTQLKQMSEDLKEIIEHLNESNKTEETSDPVAQIGRILNSHMNSLQWIDRNTAQISTYLDQISKMHDVHRRDNERSFHLTYE